jgi:hypothetical protein
MQAAVVALAKLRTTLDLQQIRHGTPNLISPVMQPMFRRPETGYTEGESTIVPFRGPGFKPKSMMRKTGLSVANPTIRRESETPDSRE